MSRPVVSVALAGALSLMACKSGADPLTVLGTGIAWQVTEIAGAPVPRGVNVTLSQPEAGQIAGTTGCNRYTGPLSEHEGKIEIGALAVTRMMCPEPQIKTESTFLAAIARVTGVSEAEGVLTLTDAAGTPVLRAHR